MSDIAPAGQPILDCDTHLYEHPTMWRDYADPGARDLALSLVADDRGWTWLTAPGGRRLHPASVPVPGDLDALGAERALLHGGAPAPYPYAETLPASMTSPEARAQRLRADGIGEALVFPNYGLFWVRSLADDLSATLANLAAWNRYAIEIAVALPSLRPVGHVVLRDPEWLDGQLAGLAAAGVRAAMVPPGAVDGKRLSHPDLDPVWRSFVHHGVAVVFHVGDGDRPLADAWYDGDPNPLEPLLMSAFIALPPQLALTDMAVGGVLARHPGLRVGVVEFCSAWLPGFLRSLDVTWSFHARSNGGPAVALDEPPSAYVRRQVRVATFGFEQPAALAEQVGDVLMFGSDWPHPEGVARPVEDFVARGGPAPGSGPAGLYAGNARWLLGG